MYFCKGAQLRSDACEQRNGHFFLNGDSWLERSDATVLHIMAGQKTTQCLASAADDYTEPAKLHLDQKKFPEFSLS
ncbi:hypothetical protein Y032_0184g1004 [Ancylostoma ceylanicum]|uniref:Uncharacterized protein n=1 Tax=Ancylostoma ceylanicum TaxID=53326 RepID=A0A016SRM7_9BILA|nr:hypothetical protein Y032_0184g1004 [Ancylostoma ceylanicum]